ncbi:hypothetical protein F383_38765 [Gossypium arboreum]|uniref:Uncharacterized protein n=1 Tax=Gossypium arboreum TaxID=29729 RepID=A0A0B0MD59_GOSAR|nr:hypothetical protein F383_38765 [Gossypium arboreum]
MVVLFKPLDLCGANGDDVTIDLTSIDEGQLG